MVNLLKYIDPKELLVKREVIEVDQESEEGVLYQDMFLSPRIHQSFAELLKRELMVETAILGNQGQMVSLERTDMVNI